MEAGDQTHKGVASEGCFLSHTGFLEDHLTQQGVSCIRRSDATVGSRMVFVAAHEDDLRVMERTSGIKAQRFADWSEATAGRTREAAFIADFDTGFVVPGRKPLVIVTATSEIQTILRSHRRLHPLSRAGSWPRRD